MSVSFSQLRAAVATQIDALAGFTESRIPPEYFGRNENSVAHKRFAVALSASNDAGERMRRAVGVYASSTVRVTFAYRLRPKDAYPTDYDAGLDTEKDVIYETNVLGEESFGVFYPSMGLGLLNKIIQDVEDDALLENIRILDDHKTQHSITEFLDKLDKWRIKKA